ncbi:hypothetical protein HII31_10245 [Pseudocercospora fuligena]|uniref:Uncharacterized protein n=1 Tax=Pseudocercospora fuligena TaxID=685502 RepID=A0A8H6RCJ8_9PEZI|nr:hypothetical protein HII31_10245 [Pseudocercospora fuligena]
MGHNLPLPCMHSGPNGIPCHFKHSSQWEPGVNPQGLALMINKALRSKAPNHVTVDRADISDLDAHVAAEYAQYQCFVEIDNLEPSLLSLDQLRSQYFEGNELASRIVKGFQYSNVPPGNSFEHIDNRVEALEPMELIEMGKMTPEEAKDYVLKMIELTWDVKAEYTKVMKALAVEEAKAKKATEQAARSEAMELEEADKDDERNDPSYGGFRGARRA